MPEQHRPKAGKIALVTGAARGIGLAYAERLALEGAIVIAADRDKTPGLREKLLSLGAPEADTHQVDVSDETQIEHCAKAILARHGRCDIIVNNAGIYPMVPFAELSLKRWRETMAINTESAFLFCHALVPSMIAQQYGRIVNTASNILGGVHEGFVHYIASKGAVIGFTRGLASELGRHGITVNAIAPGLTRTPTTEAALHDPALFDALSQAQPIKRPGLPSDLAGAMSFLTSDAAAFFTGQTLIVDGGLVRNL